MATKTTNPQQEVLQRNAQDWLKSPEGQDTIRKTLQQAKQVTARLQEERRVDLKSLHEPFTV